MHHIVHVSFCLLCMSHSTGKTDMIENTDPLMVDTNPLIFCKFQPCIIIFFTVSYLLNPYTVQATFIYLPLAHQMHLKNNGKKSSCEGAIRN